jgi:hypothetical protein
MSLYSHDHLWIFESPKPEWAQGWHLWKVIIPEDRSLADFSLGMYAGVVTDAAGFTGNSRNTLKITMSDGNAENPKARRERLMIRTVKATLLVTALACFTAIALRLGI